MSSSTFTIRDLNLASQSRSLEGHGRPEARRVNIELLVVLLLDFGFWALLAWLLL